MKKLYLTTQLLLALSSIGMAQPSQKVYPSDPTTATRFADPSKYHKGMALEKNTLAVADQEARDSVTCVRGSGTVTVYKKTADSSFVASQVLGSFMDSTQGFGMSIALRGNFLAVLSANEKWNDTLRGGSLHLFKRKNSDSDFKPFAWVPAPPPFSVNLLGFSAVALNDSFLVLSVHHSNELRVYRLGADTLLPHPSFFGEFTTPDKIGLTDNNVIIGFQENNYIRHFLIQKDTVLLTTTIFFGGYTSYTDIEVNGNTVAYLSFTARTQSTSSLGLFLSGADGMTNTDVLGLSLPHTQVDAIEIKENQWLFLTLHGDTNGYLSPEATIAGYQFKGGTYQLAQTWPQPPSATASFGSSLSYSHNLLAIGDGLDSSRAKSKEGNCIGHFGKGAVTLLSIKPSIVTGIGSNSPSDALAGPTIRPNPMTGGVLNITSSEVGTVEVYQTTGALMTRATVANGICHLENLPKGLYLLRLISPQGTHTERLVVE